MATTIQYSTVKNDKKLSLLQLDSRQSSNTLDDKDSGVEVKRLGPMFKDVQSLLRKHTQEHQNPTTAVYKEPNSAPASIDAFHKKTPLMALSNIFGLGLRSSPTRKGSGSSVSSAADSSPAPSADNVPVIPDPPQPRSRMSSFSSDNAGSKESNVTSTSQSTHNSAASTSSVPRTSKLASYAVSGPTKRKTSSREALDRPNSAQSNHRSSAATSTTVTPVPRITQHSAKSRRQTPPTSSPTRESFSSEGSGGRYRSMGMAASSVKKMSVVDEEGRLVENVLEAAESSGRRRDRESRETSTAGRASGYTASQSQASHIHGGHHRHHQSRSHSHSQHSSAPKVMAGKHGSFDFERPGWWSSHAPAYQTSPSVTSDARRSVSLRGQARKSSATHDTHLGLSIPGPDDVGGSLGRHSGRRQQNGQISEEPEQQKKKSKRNSLRILEAGFAKLRGGIWSHGAFAFEPPVSKHSPRTSLSDETAARPSRNGHRPQDPSSGHGQHSSAPLPDPIRPPKPKGRSLDLGIGLAWAPRTLREDRLLPGSHLGSDRSKSPTTVPEPEDEGDIAERKLVGVEIASVFREALDERGYAAFKLFLQRFDAHEIPFDGPKGVVARVERLLSRRAPGLSSNGQAQLLGRFVRVILQNT